jgi:hypothetical protein
MLTRQMVKMSTLTIATLPRLSANALSKILLEHGGANLDAPRPEHIAIIDVRDDGLFFLPLFHIPFISLVQ